MVTNGMLYIPLRRPFWITLVKSFLKYFLIIYMLMGVRDRFNKNVLVEDFV
jgi:hypothetical protein